MVSATTGYFQARCLSRVLHRFDGIETRQAAWSRRKRRQEKESGEEARMSLGSHARMPPAGSSWRPRKVRFLTHIPEVVCRFQFDWPMIYASVPLSSASLECQLQGKSGFGDLSQNTGI
jgi:hypothetical protein